MKDTCRPHVSLKDHKSRMALTKNNTTSPQKTDFKAVLNVITLTLYNDCVM